jgi:hypothetical protein
MSPEQADLMSGNVDTSSDVYSLGVLLYELMIGAVPFDAQALRKAGLAELLRVIREEEPEPMSAKLTGMGDTATDVAARRRTDPGTLKRLVSGDLNWIAQKAMDKDRERRYSAASELAADIRRHLEDRPVLAGPPNSVYRARKFVRRHKTGVAAGLLVGVSLVAGMAGVGREAQIAEQHRREAEAARVRAQEQWREALRQAQLADEQRQIAIREQAVARAELDRATVAERNVARERDRAIGAEQTATSQRNRALAAESTAVEERNRTLAEKRRADEESATSRALNDILQSDLLAQALLSYVPPSVAPAHVAPMTGSLRFESNMNDVQLVLDGKSLGTLTKGKPFLVAQLGPGQHSVEGRRPALAEVEDVRGHIDAECAEVPDKKRYAIRVALPHICGDIRNDAAFAAPTAARAFSTASCAALICGFCDHAVWTYSSRKRRKSGSGSLGVPLPD